MPALMRAIAAIAALLVAGICQAQNVPPVPGSYPTRPLRLIAPFAPGGPVDVVARLVAPKLSESLGTPVYVENVPGGSGNIGTGLVAKAPGDGSTALVISSSLVVNPSLFKLAYDTEKDLLPVSLLGVAPQVILVHPSVPATTMRELIALIKANPGRYSYGSAGLGTPGFLAGEMLRQAFGLDLAHVPFQGGGPAVTSTVGGHTPMVITTISSAAGHIKQGTLRALAVTGTRRSPAVPAVPTLAEAGVPDQESEVIAGVLLPGGTPKEIVDRLHRDLVKIVAEPEMKERLAAVGFEAIGSTPEEFAVRIRSEIAKWAKVIRDGNIKSQ